MRLFIVTVGHRLDTTIVGLAGSEIRAHQILAEAKKSDEFGMLAREHSAIEGPFEVNTLLTEGY